MDDRVWTRAAEEAPVRRGLGRGLAAIIPARAANATSRLPHLVVRRPGPPQGLLTRSALTERLDGVLRDARGEGAAVAVVVLGLDGFRHVEGRIGQEAGNRLLRALGERLAGARRAGDAVAHLDGDVFAVVCPRVDSVSAGAKVVGRLSEELSRPLEVAGTEERVGATFGLALCGPTPEVPGRVLLRRAEMAMLRAKDEGAPWASYGSETLTGPSDSGGTPPGGVAGASEPTSWEGRRLGLGR